MKCLSESQKHFYLENGYIVLDILTKGEINELSQEYDAVFKNKNMDNLEATWDGDWNIGHAKGEVKSIHSMEMHSAAFSHLLLNEKLLDACEDVIGSQNILLHHTKAHLKPPDTGSPFPMHQDYHYFPFKKDSMIAVFISIDQSEPENGGLCVYPGSHILGPQEDKSSVPTHHYIDQEKFPIKKATPLHLQEGQVVIFSYLLVHGSYDNKSKKPRRMHLIQLMAAEDEPLADMHRSHCQGLVLRGRNPDMGSDIKNRHLYS